MMRADGPIPFFFRIYGGLFCSPPFFSCHIYHSLFVSYHSGNAGSCDISNSYTVFVVEKAENTDRAELTRGLMDVVYVKFRDPVDWGSHSDDAYLTLLFRTWGMGWSYVLLCTALDSILPRRGGRPSLVAHERSAFAST